MRATSPSTSSPSASAVTTKWSPRLTGSPFTVPDAPIPVSPIATDSAGARETVYVSNEFFTVRKWEVSGHHTAPVDAPYLLVGVLEGSGTVNGEPVSRGDHFVVTALADALDVEGDVALMVTSAA
jgi:mannose-6-phosphate isomerase